MLSWRKANRYIRRCIRDRSQATCSRTRCRSIRQHALESACFVVNATAWLAPEQQARIVEDTGCSLGPITGGCFTAIITPEGAILGEPVRRGEGEVIADLDFALIDQRK